MAKFYGAIGYSIITETSPGVWIDEVVERNYTGDEIKAKRIWQPSENVNPNFTISDSISIVADEFMLANMQMMKYVRWRGAVWSINSISIDRPRMVLAIGGLFNGNTTSSSPVDETGGTE